MSSHPRSNSNPNPNTNNTSARERERKRSQDQPIPSSSNGNGNSNSNTPLGPQYIPRPSQDADDEAAVTGATTKSPITVSAPKRMGSVGRKKRKPVPPFSPNANGEETVANANANATVAAVAATPVPAAATVGAKTAPSRTHTHTHRSRKKSSSTSAVVGSAPIPVGADGGRERVRTRSTRKHSHSQSRSASQSHAHSQPQSLSRAVGDSAAATVAPAVGVGSSANGGATREREREHAHSRSRSETAQSVAKGEVGGGFGPYAYNPSPNRNAGIYKPTSKFVNPIPPDPPPIFNSPPQNKNRNTITKTWERKLPVTPGPSVPAYVATTASSPPNNPNNTFTSNAPFPAQPQPQSHSQPPFAPAPYTTTPSNPSTEHDPSPPQPHARSTSSSFSQGYTYPRTRYGYAYGPGTARPHYYGGYSSAEDDDGDYYDYYGTPNPNPNRNNNYGANGNGNGGANGNGNGGSYGNGGYEPYTDSPTRRRRTQHYYYSSGSASEGSSNEKERDAESIPFDQLSAASRRRARLTAANTLTNTHTQYTQHTNTEKDPNGPNGYAYPTFDDLDDPLHDPSPPLLVSPFYLFSLRGWVNVGFLVVLVTGLLLLFAGFPIINGVQRARERLREGGNGLGLNASGLVPVIEGKRGGLVDDKTPENVKEIWLYGGWDVNGGGNAKRGGRRGMGKRAGGDTKGEKYTLVFSDEFEREGRTFWPGDDPFWEAADLHYWPTGNLEWYDPHAATTANGSLVLTMTEQSIHDLDFMSGMVTSWNKLCFNTGYVEVSIAMPGTPKAPGLWPGAWMMGNLGRAGYGATTEGMWPYSYDSCDVGTFTSQLYPNNTPTAALTGGPNHALLSALPGQRLSSCTCPDSDHPGPEGTGRNRLHSDSPFYSEYSTAYKARNVPELDILEGQIDVSGPGKWIGQVSQSVQVAPYNDAYKFANGSEGVRRWDEWDWEGRGEKGDRTVWNGYMGGPYQQAVSALTYVREGVYVGESGVHGSWGSGESEGRVVPDTPNPSFATFGLEWYSDEDGRLGGNDPGYVTWYTDGKEAWRLTAAGIGGDSVTGIGPRIISEEPMYLILNLGMSPFFQKQDWKHLQFPARMYIDYVRVYQREGTKEGVTCDPSHHPTTEYIARHSAAYSNANLTTWAMANNTFPRNALYDGC